MDAAIQELIKQSPWAASILGVIWLLLRYVERMYDKMTLASENERQERTASAIAKAQQDRETQQIIAKTYADAINTLAKSVSELSERNEKSMREFKEAVLEQYKNMGVTKEILDFAMGRIKEQEAKRK
jgi:regulator of protease activity HflC (stomatin/prohibitin superfamily)